jgi:hypothetical protein
MIKASSGDSYKLIKNCSIQYEIPTNQDKFQIIFCSNGCVRDNIAGFGVVASIEEKIIQHNKQILPETYNKYTLA